MGAEISRELEESRPQPSQPQPSQPQPQPLPQPSQPQQQPQPQSLEPQQQQQRPQAQLRRPQSPQAQQQPRPPQSPQAQQQPRPQQQQQQPRPQSLQPQQQQQRPQAQAQLRPPQSPQAQQQPRPQPQQQPPRPQSLQPQQQQQRAQAQLIRPPQSPEAPQQPRPHEASSSSRDAWLLSPQSQSKELNNFPHKCEDILKEADSPVDKSSRDQLYNGVFLHHNTQKYWVENKSNANCFMLYARALSITWAQDQRYWKWVPQKEASGTITEMAELKRVCWLEVHGKFDTRKLSPGIPYQVSFIVMLKDPAQGWEVPVNVRLALPGGKRQQRKENLIDKLRVRWIEIPVGEFVASDQQGGAGEMEFSMYEYEGGMWKQGLVIKGVSIKPKNYD